MSYILDALKRAEAERSGSTPARAALPGSFSAAPAKRASRSFALLGLGLVVGTAGAVFALTVLRELPAEREARSVETAKPEKALAAMASHPAPSVPDQPQVTPAVIIPAPAATQSAAVPVTKKSGARAPALGTLRDLPEHIQREIPPLAVGGFLYSANPSDRTVLLNKRLRREGDEVAPGLVLEALRPNGMVFNYRGHRYRSTY